MLWQNVKSILREKLPEGAFSLWVEPLKCIREDERCLELAGPDRFFCSWVHEHYQGKIQQALTELNKPQVQIRYSVAQAEETKRLPEPAVKKEQLRLPNMPERRNSVRTLHPRYTFEEFMVGESNALAHSACDSIARGDSSLSPCLFINAGTGLGKSHLAHAVGHHLMNNAPEIRLHYLTSQQLTGEVVRNIKNNTMDQFKDKYLDHCDVLLLEDVQLLAGRIKTQAELAEVLDVLMEKGKRIVFTCAMAPKDIPNIDEGVRSRLSAGLITTINPPDPHTRRLIIERKARNNQLQLSEELVDYLAENIRGDIRQVESAIVGLRAKASLIKVAPDLDMVKEVIANIVGSSQNLTSELIRDFIATQFKVSVNDLCSKSRKQAISFPRQISMYLARKLTEQPLADIGKTFNRDHSTVVHSIRVINEAIARKGSVRGQVEHLTKKLKQQYS